MTIYIHISFLRTKLVTEFRVSKWNILNVVIDLNDVISTNLRSQHKNIRLCIL